ncbi:hypothetical protein AB0B28_12225 [Glycomyces sp. NPDC046736]|uniref:hypothetical protein n=1 Tax=Glycomyces sp. NPDC046736 TaxID=3155615 RepID=UPI0033F31FF4
MPTTEDLPTRTRREGLRVGWLALFAVLSLIPLNVWHHVREPDSPEEVVAAFMEAVRDKDLDEAFGYVDSGIPAGPDADFLHPDAISEWDLLEVYEIAGMKWENLVRVTIGTEDGTASGVFKVYEFEGEYTIADPFQSVSLTATSYLSVQVNDRVVAAEPDSNWINWYSGQVRRTVELLPGVYSFFGGEPVALLGYQEEPIGVVVPPPAPGGDTAVQLQAAVNEYLDACVEYRVEAPTGCPFATDGQVDTSDRVRMDRVEDAAWTIEEYPVATAVPGTGLYEEPVLLVEFTEPGRLTLEGTGTADFDTRETFTAACRFGGGLLHLVTDVDGSLRVAPLGTAVDDTCRGTE